jgi:hypothetical protein
MRQSFWPSDAHCWTAENSLPYVACNDNLAIFPYVHHPTSFRRGGFPSLPIPMRASDTIVDLVIGSSLAKLQRRPVPKNDHSCLMQPSPSLELKPLVEPREIFPSSAKTLHVLHSSHFAPGGKYQAARRLGNPIHCSFCAGIFQVGNVSTTTFSRSVSSLLCYLSHPQRCARHL